MIIEHLFQQKESLDLEFKRDWYWGKEITGRKNNIITIKKDPKTTGEMLKDLVALINTKSDEKTSKYMVIGFDEKTKEKFCISSINKENLGFNNTDELQDIVIKDINNFFKASCLDGYLDCSKIPLDEFITFGIERVENKDILIITIKETPFILESIKDIQTSGSHTIKSGTVLSRKLKLDNSPENGIATIQEIKDLEKKTKSKVEIELIEKTLTVKKLVHCFKKSQVPRAEVIEQHNQEDDYEHYTINAPIINKVFHIVYFNKKTPQTKTAKVISESGKITKEDQLFLITENKNTKGGNFNEKKIKKDFNDVDLNPEIFTIEHFSSEKIYEDIFSSEILHDGSFPISDFVSPPPVNNKDVDFIITEWLDSEKLPLLVMKGSGGIGKTTVIKSYLNKIYKQRSQKIIFINSHDLINTLNESNEEISDIYDFYRAFLKKEEYENEIDKKIFELTIDHGNLLFVIDGIDEVLAKLGSKLEINKLIASIFEDYVDTIGKTKIIFTCRDEFWNLDKYDEKIKTITLSPFSLDQAKKYFEKKFQNNENKIKKAIKIATDYSIGDSHFIPYLLDMISEDLISDEKFDSFPDSYLIDPKIQNDFIIGKFCDREVLKLGHESIDSQLSLFIDLAKKHYGKSNAETLKRQNNLSSEQSTVYKAHTLLSYDSESDSISFKYDFFEQHFKAIDTFNFFKKNETLENINKDDLRSISESISSPITIEYFKKRFETEKDLPNQMKDLLYLNKFNFEENKELNSSILYIIISSLQIQNKEERTELIKYIFESEIENTLELIPIMNFYPLKNTKITFDFRGLKINKSIFENYLDFSNCDFGEEEIFHETIFKKPLYQKKKKPNYTRKNFSSSCNTLDLNSSLEEVEANEKSSLKKKAEDLNKLLRFFYPSGTFKQKLESKVKAHMKNSPKIIETLIKNKIIIRKEKTTREKKD